MKYAMKHRTPRQEGRLIGALVKGLWDRKQMESEAEAGDATAGDLAGGKGLAVFVGEVEDREAEAMACPSQPVSLGGLFQPVDEVLARSSLAAASRSSLRG